MESIWSGSSRFAQDVVRVKMIETAVVPAAGFGSRMGPLTMAIPKEMLPLGHTAMIEYTIRELVS